MQYLSQTKWFKKTANEKNYNKADDNNDEKTDYTKANKTSTMV